MIGRFAKKIARLAARRRALKKLERLVREGLPGEMRLPLTFLLTGARDGQTAKVTERVEGRRRQIASCGDQEVTIWYSPKPGTAGDDAAVGARPQPGQRMRFTMERISKTGKNRRWGTALYLIARAFECRVGFELGACAGLSASYLSSAPSIEKFITVEGSDALANIAATTLAWNPKATVVNASFDEAIDTEVPFLEGDLDLAYIDGHHEKVATLHYFNRLLPFLKSHAVVLFDDISWSEDMREAWDLIRVRREFAHSIDLGVIGICLLKPVTDPSNDAPKQWDLRPLVGHREIGTPRGWQEQEEANHPDSIKRQ